MSNGDSEDRIASRIDKAVAGALTVTKSQAAGLAFETMAQVLEFAKLMSISGVAVPKHLRSNPGACLAICVQALEWRQSPFAVANKSYSVNDRLAYEAQLINAVILSRAPIEGRFDVKYSGEGDNRVCRVAVRPKVGDRLEYASPRRGDISPKNSPLWKTDPDQQQFYYTSRALCRRYFPDVLLGVYADDELPTIEADKLTKEERVEAAKDLNDRLDSLIGQTLETSEPSEGSSDLAQQGSAIGENEAHPPAEFSPPAADIAPPAEPQKREAAAGFAETVKRITAKGDSIAKTQGYEAVESWMNNDLTSDEMALITVAMDRRWRQMGAALR